MTSSFTPLNINYEKKLHPLTQIKTKQGLDKRKQRQARREDDENIEIENEDLMRKKVNCIESFKAQQDFLYESVLTQCIPKKHVENKVDSEIASQNSDSRN